MKSWSVIIAGFIFCSSIAFAQEPAQPDQLFSSDLVVWSSMQEPQQPEQDHPHQQPTPDPTPETQPAPNPTPSQPGRSTLLRQRQSRRTRARPRRFLLGPSAKKPTAMC